MTIVAPDLPGSSEQGVSGRDIEIVSETLKTCGYEPDFVIQPFGRHMRSFEQMARIDGVMTVPLDAELPGYSTSAYIWYQNGAFYNASRIGPIETVNDLAGLDVVTFKNGIEILGLREFGSKLGSVLMVTDQMIHSRLLFKGRVHAILADGSIVAEVNQRLAEERRRAGRWPMGDAEFRFAPIFNPSPFKMVFKEKEVAERVDACFGDLYAQGAITRINDRYLGKYQSQLRFRYLGR